MNHQELSQMIAVAADREISESDLLDFVAYAKMQTLMDSCTSHDELRDIFLNGVEPMTLKVVEEWANEQMEVFEGDIADQIAELVEGWTTGR